MSRTVINVSAVIDATRQINSAKTFVSSAKSSFTQTKNNIDGKIQDRCNIKGRLNTVQRQLSNIDSKIDKIRSTVQSGANQYRTTDDRVESWKTDLKSTVGVRAVGTISGNWASCFKNNGEISGVQKQTDIDDLIKKHKVEEFGEVITVAGTCAGTFESVDSQLAKVSSDSSSEIKNEVGKVLESETVAGFLAWLKGDWVDDEFADKPLWFRESLKETLKDIQKNYLGENFTTFYNVTQKISEGDYLGALKEYVNHIYKKEGFFEKIETKFYVNSIFGALEGFQEFCENPSFSSLAQIGWNFGPGSAFDTAGDAAWDVVKLIPGVSDWYEQHGATDAGSAFNTMYTEWTRVFFGDKIADEVSTYYADNGGLFYGLVNGGEQIVNEVKESCDRHGGIFGVWLSGWNSIFH